MNEFIKCLKQVLRYSYKEKRAFFLVLSCSFFFVLFLLAAVIQLNQAILLVYSVPIGVLLYIFSWILCSTIVCYFFKFDIRESLIKDSISYLPSILLLAYVFTIFMRLERIYPFFDPSGIYTHLLKSIFLFLAGLVLSLIISLKVFIFYKPLSNASGKLITKLKSAPLHIHFDLIVYLLIMIFFLVFSFLLYSKLNALEFYSGDVPAYVQRIWFITRTGVPKSTIFHEIGDDPHVFIISRSMILYLLSPFFFVFPNTLTILLAHTFTLSVTSVPIYLVGKKILKSQFMAAMLSFGFLLHPSIQYLYIGGFRPDTFGMFFLTIALYAMFKGKYKLFLFASVFMIMTKENFFLIGLILGLYVMYNYNRLYGSLCTVFSIIWFLTVFFVFPTSNTYNILDFYSYLGSDYSEAIQTIINKPIFVLSHVFALPKFAYLVTLLLPLLITLPFISRLSVATFPILAQNLFSDRLNLYTIIYHYSAIIIPLLYFSVIEALIKIQKSKLTSNFNKLLDKIAGVKNFNSEPSALIVSMILLIFFFSIICSGIYGPHGYIYQLDVKDIQGHTTLFKKDLYTAIDRDRIAKEIVLEIPRNASVVASEPFYLILSKRERIYTLPHTLSNDISYIPPDKIDYILVDIENPVVKGTRTFVGSLEKSPNWKKILEKEGFVVFKSNRGYI